MNNLSQRDAFWNRIYDFAKLDKDVVIVAADMGAPSLDKFRRDLPAQFINVGIAEQNAITLASGLALTGKRVYAYAIAPFITLRCLEQIRVENAIMHIPITIVGVGAGFGYSDSGPTHHLIEDIAVMRAMPNIAIHNPTDSVMASTFAALTYENQGVHYVRLERQACPVLYQEGDNFRDGFKVLKKGKDALLLSTGAITHTALEIAQKISKQGIDLGVVDLFSFPLAENKLLDLLAQARKLITLEEHFLPGGLGSMVGELLMDQNLLIPVKRLGLSHLQKYCYTYGGREEIRRYYGIDGPTIKNEIVRFMKKK